MRRLSSMSFAAAVLVGMAVALPQGSAAGLDAPGDLSAPDTCRSRETFLFAEAVSPDGSRVRLPFSDPVSALTDAAKDTSRGRSYHYAIDGIEAQQILPPTDWMPTALRPKEADAYGLEPRPSDAAAAREWDASVRTLKVQKPGPFCVLSQSNSISHTDTSFNWGGGMNVNGTPSTDTYFSAHVRWTQPSYVAACPSASRNSIWAGRGGWNQTTFGLAQNGTDVDGATLNGAHFWWEILRNGSDTSEATSGAVGVSAGEYVGATTRWDSSQQGFWFYFYNFTRGQSAPGLLITNTGGGPMSAFYDGSTADYVSESPTNTATGQYFQLRKPSSASTPPTISFPYALANGQAIGNFGSWRINTLHQPGSGLKQGSWFDGTNAWTNEWYQCS